MDGRLMIDDLAQGLRAIYLVVEPDPLLRADLTEILQYGDKDALVIAVATPDEALAKLGAAPAVRLALVAAGPTGFSASRLGQLTLQRGAAVVLMGRQAECHGEAAGFPVLHRPYSQNHVLALMSQ